MTQASPYPSEGAKLLLERQRVADDGERADYTASIYLPDRRYDFDARLAMDGSAELSPREDNPDPTPDPAIAKALTNIAKSIARAAKRKRDEGLPPWPHRINRWRGPGRG
jgi:hypothetical protein